jgi:enediyne biosynthesis protein E4
MINILKMSKMIKRISALSCFILLVISCQVDDKTLFRLIDNSKSGIDFRNDIFDNEQFNIITQQYIYNGGGVAIGDFNNDGLQDIFFTGNMVPNKLYLNQGDLKFKDVSEEASIGGFNKWKSGVALVDINVDGLLDIYVCATMSEDSTLRTNMMFINQGISEKGIPTFVDKAKDYGIDDNGFSSNATFFDYDNDGDLDLYILTNSRQPGLTSRYLQKVNDGSSTNTDKLFRNNNDGTFTDVSKQAGILSEGYGLGLAIADINKDGLSDIYVSNDYITNDLLYLNQGNGKFENKIDDQIKHQAKFSMGNDIGDINNDGFPDIITVDMLPETNLRKKTVIVGPGYTSYINDVTYGYTHQHVRNML